MERPSIPALLASDGSRDGSHMTRSGPIAFDGRIVDATTVPARAAPPGLGLRIDSGKAMTMDIIGRHVSELSGYAPALPTPFDDEGNIDGAAFERFCDRQIQEGATALVVCGTTGEAPTLSPAEHRALIRIAVDVAHGRIPVIAGAGSNSTAHAMELTKDAEALGADAILSVVPYYNKPTQAGLFAHFRAVAQSSGLPIILYDVPSRTACSLADETVVRLAEMPQFVALKDATGDVTRPARLRLHVRPDFRLLSGDDATAPAFLAQGGNGCISVTSNVAPGLCRSMFLACKQGQAAKAQWFANPIAQLTYALFREPNPVPLKYALSLLGLMSPKVRLPLVELADRAKAEVAAVMSKLCDENAEHLIGRMCRDQHGNRRAATW
jgi:4-hydroxy-tetrahydrodipicolinate synthase